MKYHLAEDYRDKGYVLVEMPVALVPIVAGQLRFLEQRRSWVSEADYERGYNAVVELQIAMAGARIRDIVDAIDRLYRLHDVALNGANYVASTNPADPERPLIAPDLPAVPTPGLPFNVEAMRAHIARLHQLAENAATGATYGADSTMAGTVALDYDGSWRARLEALQGTIPAGWFGLASRPVTLSDVYQSLRIGGEDPAARIDTALEALSAASSTANVFGVVRGLLSDAVDTGIDGGVLAVLIASSIANAGAQGILSGQIDRLIRALDGGGINPPSENVLDELGAIKVQLS